MKIILIDSISIVKVRLEPQLGPLIIRDLLKEEHDVELISFTTKIANNQLELKKSINDNIIEFSKEIIQKRPDVVTFYTMCDSFYYSLRIAERIKKLQSNIIIIFAGPHATLLAEECLNEFWFIDYIGLGEGEKTVLPLMNAIEKNYGFEKLEGIAFRKYNKVIINKQKNFIDNEELGNYTPYDYKPYLVEKMKVISIEGGRGCPFNCSFCSTSKFWGRRYRIKPVEVLMKEMKLLNEKYGFRYFTIQHDMFTANKEHIVNFCNFMLEDGNGYFWGCSSRIDVLDKSLIQLMADAKCKNLFLGIESGSPKMQKSLNKNLDLNNVLDKVRFIEQVGIKSTLSFIYGFPDEKIEDFKMTIDLIEQLFINRINNISLHMFMPLPKTNETKKIVDHLYFDEKCIEPSIFIKGLYTKGDFDYIKEHKEVFLQFFSFKSEIREKYSKFPLLLSVLRNSFNVFTACIIYLIKKMGLVKLYEKYQDDIIRLDYIIQDKMFQEDKWVLIKKQYEFIENILDREFENEINSEYKQVYLFEKLIMKSKININSNSEIYEFDYDVFEARNNFNFIRRKTLARILNEGDNNVRVAKLSIKK
ncbi:B12-binding domain-containing radical SAM protein [Clostridium tunisiense]|uniref:B12-binding domain-containing radical SAM protein n=1 Tax=Clostridium tunisiense TaxID=219748 RepID=UPI0002F835BC|nr:radical SAM protein [Clostridium tunisiense]